MGVLWSGGCFVIYQHRLYTDKELFGDATSDVEKRMQDFLESDFRSIENYLKCLAFDPRIPAPGGTEN